jgi:hypothetical protein
MRGLPNQQAVKIRQFTRSFLDFFQTKHFAKILTNRKKYATITFMIHEILSTQDCAKCKGCCIFAKGEEWESPLTTLPMHGTSGDCMVCCRLTEHGCDLGQDKPVECAMYPFRIMRVGEHKAITLSRYCKPVTALPLSRLYRFADEKAEMFLQTADTHPEIVKEYNHEYVILKIIES